MKRVILLSSVLSFLIVNGEARVVTQVVETPIIDTVSYDIIDKGDKREKEPQDSSSNNHTSNSSNSRKKPNNPNRAKKEDPRTAISISRYVQFSEAQANKEKMKFIIAFSKKVKRSFDLRYKIVPKNGLEIGEDIVKPSGVLHIKKGQKRAVLTIEVINDKKAEDAEYFNIYLQKPNKSYKFFRRRAIGVILDDEIKLQDIDTKGNYLVKESGSSSDKIRTKIVNKPFNLDIKAKEGFEIFTGSRIKEDKICSDKIICHEEGYGDNGKARECIRECTIKKTITLNYSEKMDIDRVILHTYNEYDKVSRTCVNERKKITLLKDANISSGKMITLNVLPKSATPCAWVEVQGRSERGYEKDKKRDKMRRVVKSFVGRSDTFAIRPKKFTLPSNLTIKAGKPTNIDFKAVDFGNITHSIGYNEKSGVSFKVTASKLNPNCTYNNDLNTTGLNQFVDGLLSGKLSYDNVGKLKVKISEIKGQEFASIDRDDTPYSKREIKEAEGMINFVPYQFDTHVSYSNNHTNSGYAFYSNSLYDGPTWKYNIVAINAKGNKVTNFDESCVGIDAKDVNLGMIVNVKSNGDLNSLKSNIGDKHISDKNESIVLTSKIPPFVDGVASKNITINFGRNKMVPTAPSIVYVSKFIVADKYGTKFIINSNIPSNGVYYQYMRAYIQSPITVIGSNELKTKIHYETYDPFGVARGVIGNSISTESAWREVKFEPSSGKMRVFGLKARFASLKRSIPQNESNINLLVKTKQIPEKNVITMNVDNDFSYLKNYISTNVSFLPNSANWAGKGKTGNTIDTTISKREGFDKIVW